MPVSRKIKTSKKNNIVKHSKKTYKYLKTINGGATGPIGPSKKQNNNTINKINIYIRKYITNKTTNLRIYLQPHIEEITKIALYYNNNNIDFTPLDI